MNPFQVLLGALLLFALPGYFLTKALFPRGFDRGHDVVLTAFLSLVLSVSVAIVVGAGLGFLPADPECGNPPCGWFQGSATGAPILELALGSVALVAFGVATARGAFPRVAALLGRASERIVVTAGGSAEDGSGSSIRRDLVGMHARLRAARMLGNDEVAQKLEEEIRMLEMSGRAE